MREHEDYQVDGSAPALYQRHLVPAVTAVWAADLVERAQPRSGERVLDVACGTGVVARLVAGRMASGLVVGLDINGGMLAIAQSLSPIEGASIEWCAASALQMPFADARFDLVLCQLGLQFFPDRGAALRDMRRVLGPDGRLALSVFSAIERTPAANALATALDRHLGATASVVKRSEHALADPAMVRALVTGEGFRDVVLATVTQAIRFASAADYVRIQLTATPMAGLVRDMERARRETLVAAIAQEVASATGADAPNAPLCFTQEAHVLLARP